MLCCWNFALHNTTYEDTAHNRLQGSTTTSCGVVYVWQITFTFFACSGALVTPAHLLELAVGLLKVFG